MKDTKNTKSIMIVGVGGQGTLLASRVLGHAILQGGYDVKVSEVHGMSQRGGSVVTYVRYGKRVDSPTVDQGQADLLLAFEAGGQDCGQHPADRSYAGDHRRGGLSRGADREDPG